MVPSPFGAIALFGGQRGHRAPGMAAQQAHGQRFAAQDSDSADDVETFAAGDSDTLTDARDMTHSKIGDDQGAVQGGIGGYADDRFAHRAASSTGIFANSSTISTVRKLAIKQEIEKTALILKQL